MPSPVYNDLLTLSGPGPSWPASDQLFQSVRLPKSLNKASPEHEGSVQ